MLQFAFVRHPRTYSAQLERDRQNILGISRPMWALYALSPCGLCKHTAAGAYEHIRTSTSAGVVTAHPYLTYLEMVLALV